MAQLDPQCAGLNESRGIALRPITRAVNNELLGEYICSILPVRDREFETFQPGGSDKNFSQEGRFFLAKKEKGGWGGKNTHDRSHMVEYERNFAGKAEVTNLE